MTNSKHYICAHCTAINTLDLTELIKSKNKLAAIPTCNQCQQVIFSGQPLTLNDDNFTKVIEATDLPLIVDFWSISCGPCKAMLPAYAKASELLFPRAIVAKLNIETSPQTTEKYDVRGLPTFIVFKDGQSTTRKIGAMTTKQIVEWVESVI